MKNSITIPEKGEDNEKELPTTPKQLKSSLKKDFTSSMNDSDSESIQNVTPTFIDRTSSLPLKFDDNNNQITFEPSTSTDIRKNQFKEVF